MATYYVSSSGNNSNPGTVGSPWLTWQYAFNLLSAGDTLYVRGGTYTPAETNSGGRYCGARIVGRNGTSANRIKILAYPGEAPVLNCSNVTSGGAKAGLFVDYCSYIDFKGLTIQYANENATPNDGPADGFILSDSDHINVEQCIVTRCGYGFYVASGCDEIYITNCDAYDNADLQFGAVSSGGIGGYCDGFGVHNLDSWGHVYFTGCRGWNNSDDGWDCTSSNGYIYYTNCWAFENGHTSGAWAAAAGITGDGDGFKTGVVTGSKQSGTQRVYRCCVAFQNDLMGFDESADYEALVDMALYNCTSFQNSDNGYGFYQLVGSGIVTLVNCIAYDNGDDVDLRGSCVETTNSWDVATVTDADFDSVTPTGVTGARQSDGTLPLVAFLHLAAGSDCLNAGTNILIAFDCDGYAFNDPPSLGAFEFGSTPPPPDVPVESIEIEGNPNITTNHGTTQLTANVLPVLATNKTLTWQVIPVTGNASVNSSGLVTGLSNGTVTIRATAFDGSGVFDDFLVSVTGQGTVPTGGLRDRDGNLYTSVIIGSQEWIIENLHTTKYADGSVIPNNITNEEWIGEETVIKYGYLYNWFAVNDARSIANTDWHVPTDAEMTILTDYLGGLNVAGGKLKETGIVYWQNPNGGATNLSKFYARASGDRVYNTGAFIGLQTGFGMWAATQYNANQAWGRGLTYLNDDASLLAYDKNAGLSVRLIKDSTTLSDGETDTYIGNDGRIYNTICIGTQEWLSESLIETKYQNGDLISEVTNDAAWIALATGARCSYDNDENYAFEIDYNPTDAYCWYDNDTGNESIYGALYNWLAVDNAHGLAYLERNGVHEPDWKVPSETDFQTLITYLGGDTVAGGKLKEMGFDHWTTPNEGATNESGFTALGAGARSEDGTFDYLTEAGQFWTATEDSATDAIGAYLGYDNDDVSIGDYNKNRGYSVRLVRDYVAPPEPPPVPPVYENVIPNSYGNIPEYRFYVNESPSSITYEVFPLKFLSTTISYELQKDKIYYRQKFNNSLLFGSNSKAYDVLGAEHNRREDWLLFWGFEQTDPYARIEFIITRTFGGSTIIYFEGYFSVTNGNFDIDNCTFEVTPLPIDDYTDILENADIQHNILSVPAMGIVNAVHGDIDEDYTRTRWLAKIGSDNVLEYLAEQTVGGSVTVVSEFFTSDPNYVTLDDNLLLHLTIAQKSDIIRNVSTDPATYAAMSWNELMDILWNMFQVTWTYDLSINTIYVEHISWFTRALGIDLRTQLACVATNKYNYLKEEMPKFEKFSFMEADGNNFVGAFIWYDSPAVSQDSESNRIETKINVTTDLEYIISNPDAIEDEGFVILCNYLDGADYYVRMDAGKFVTTEFALNMNLSVANLQDAYHRHNRVLIYGYLNGLLTNFWSARKTKQQTCNAILCEELDPMEEITTELGETYFGGAKATIKQVAIVPSGESRFTLIYGPPDNENTGVPNLFTVEVTLVVRSPYDPAFDEIDLLYVFNTLAVGNIATRFRVIMFDDLGALFDTSIWTDVTLLDGTDSKSVLSHQILPMSAGYKIAIEFEYPGASIDVLTGVPDVSWSYYVPFIYTEI
jgi:uncharacterized protein (TIGR02145 family)